MPWKPREMECKQCKNKYEGIPGRKYCSYKCAKKSREYKKEVTCLNCDKIFTVQNYRSSKYCSKKCKIEHKSNPIIEKSCTNCGKIIKRKSQRFRGKNYFCTKACSDNFNRGSNHYEWKEHLHNKSTKLALKQWSIKIKEKDKYICQLCGEKDTNILEAHHIKEKSKFPELMYNFENGTTLCLKCHAQKHIDDEKSFRLIECKIKKYYGS